MNQRHLADLSRRDWFRLGLTGTAALIGSRRAWGQSIPLCGEPGPQGLTELQTGLGVGGEAFPTSPFILEPFGEELPGSDLRPLNAMRPGYRLPDGTLAPGAPWYARKHWDGSHWVSEICNPGPGSGEQDCFGARRRTAGLGGAALPDAGTHQCWPGTPGSVVANYPSPIYYHIRLQVGTHDFTRSRVVPIVHGGNTVALLPPGATDQGLPIANAGFDPVWGPTYRLPSSTIYGFNGTFPGPRINAMYGQPVCVRFENDLDLNPLCRNRQNFGAPDWAFLTHLHNGHTAPESDGQPHHMTENDGGYCPGEWVDNLYLNYPPGGDNAEKQSFLWFHDHRMHHTGANVYKGMVGLYPIYDPVLDPGDETNGKGLRLPGRKKLNGDGTFDVKYDIPMALYDCCLDDGMTPHQDWHNGTGELHPEWWGKTFFRHYPNHGFVGDIFTINGVAYPVLHVYRRKYRLRFLDASIARCYELMLMRSAGGPVPAPGTQGQWQLPDGQQCMRLTQIASEGGLLPRPIIRDSFQIWPAKRREFVVDFTQYMDKKSPTRPGDVIYLVNVLEMPNGRKPNFNAPGANLFYKAPMMKIVIMGDPPERDLSQVPSNLRPMPDISKFKKTVPPNFDRQFILQRGGTAGGETEWLINGLEFNPTVPLALPKLNGGEVWNIVNGGGGWVHPMHLHAEEHTVLTRQGSTNTHPDDTGKEDVIALDPAESVWLFRRFRTFCGNYVAHCHNLAHEDHNMMFGFSVVP